MNVFVMERSIIRPLGRDAQNRLIGYVGENNSRSFYIRTQDNISSYTTVSLLIDKMDCGAMTVTAMPDGSKLLSLTLNSAMIGKAGVKTCQIVMAGDNGLVQKSAQFQAFVGAANDVDQAEEDGAALIIISQAITDMIASAAEDIADAAQEVIDSIPSDYSALSEDVADLKADLEDLDDRVETIESSDGGDGLTDAIKFALLACFDHVAWDDDDPTGQTYIDALYDALYPPADLVSISVVYTQSGTVYDTDTLDSLKSDLVCTAHMSDQSTRIVTTYTLSGSLIEGTSTITVSYGGYIATFSVTVSSIMQTIPITWSGSGSDSTTNAVDARNGDLYWTLPFVDGFAGYSSGATRDSEFIRIQASLYSDSETQTRVGVYYIDTETIEPSGRTTANRPAMPCESQIKIAPAGYYVVLTATRVTGGGFKDNANSRTFLNTYANSVKLMVTSGG